MAHPDGGQGATFQTRHTFEEAYELVGDGLQLPSTTGETITAARLERFS